MKQSMRQLEFNIILKQLEELAFTEEAKTKIRNLEPDLSEIQVRRKQKETTEARMILDAIGTPPLTSMADANIMVLTAVQGGMLTASQLEYLGDVLTGISRLKDFMNRSKPLEAAVAYYGDDLEPLHDIREAIRSSVRGGLIDDYATNTLRDIRRGIRIHEDKMKEKADAMLRGNKEYFSDSFVVKRNGRMCLPVKKEYKFKVNGSVIDKSSTGATLFVEPTAVAKLGEELMLLKLDEDNEERMILYTLSGYIADASVQFEQNLKVASRLDFIFAKGKLSAAMGGRMPSINTEGYFRIVKGQHPLLNAETCVPLDFEIGCSGVQEEARQVADADSAVRGVVITGPNTGGKTVAIKTIGLLSLMAQSGLHIPCKQADIGMVSQVLCDIGDGQNITENLSTFSAHITKVLEILKGANRESLVILDELGSGTDPAEGMGIAIAILEQLKGKGCLFVATTHYPEVKTYADREEGIRNARMAFDRESLRPLYRLEIGKSGESCALYIAKRLGMPDEMIIRAAAEAYGNGNPKENSTSAETMDLDEMVRSLGCLVDGDKQTGRLEKESGPKVQKKKAPKSVTGRADTFRIGDSVMVYPEHNIGIVCRKADEKGWLMVQLKKKKIQVNHKRLKLVVAAEELYPDDYDFSIIFDTVANRKARHTMDRKHQEGLEIVEEPGVKANQP